MHGFGRETTFEMSSSSWEVVVLGYHYSSRTFTDMFPAVWNVVGERDFLRDSNTRLTHFKIGGDCDWLRSGTRERL